MGILYVTTTPIALLRLMHSQVTVCTYSNLGFRFDPLLNVWKLINTMLRENDSKRRILSEVFHQKQRSFNNQNITIGTNLFTRK